jgi:hypothetical protein
MGEKQTQELPRCDASSIVVLYRDRGAGSTPYSECFRIVPQSGWRSHALALVAVGTAPALDPRSPRRISAVHAIPHERSKSQVR